MDAAKTTNRIGLITAIALLVALALMGAIMPAYAQAPSEELTTASVESGNILQTTASKVTSGGNYNATAIKKGKRTIKNTTSYAAIEADVKLAGSGTGRHAKLVIVTPTSAISFGIQWDEAAGQENQRRRAMLMVENIRSNEPGGQSYFWPTAQRRQIEVPNGKKVHLMLTLKKDGSGCLYVNGTRVGRYVNPNLKNKTVYLRVEGAARKNGDSISASFTNIKLKNGGKYYPKRKWGTYQFTSNKTVRVTKATGKTVLVKGKITGWPDDVDWDSPGYYDKASGLIQFT